ncbi:MAG: twin-arginine translocase TatA/TatE family subunit [Acidobacteriaceae bacterium]|nr:twin-arginine translocase TatA/TatE family subunit [Acidobacteriaceae bacterium]MBV9780739.1 twin-arginine translocase TatA/TatE family subunit [Acidobacteriaceae bacterium]
MLSAPELLVIAIVLLLLFGGKKIPDLARGLGLGIRNFKSSIKNEEEAEEKEEQK